MKNLLKLLPVFALAIGTTVAFAQNSPFETKKTSFTYYRVAGEWVEAIPGNVCDLQEPKICSQSFENPNPAPEDEGTDTVYGNYLPE